MIGGAPVPGPPGPAGDPGDPGASGEFAPLAPSAMPNPHTAEYLLRVTAGKMFQITLRGHIVNRDPPSITDRKIASFEKVATIKANAAGNVATPPDPACGHPNGYQANWARRDVHSLNGAGCCPR